ncbi:hypothetical protein [Radiobacillus sp. PE A8.2]|uniref:hypothetical protein n=1 Tax=Radiobacillus sp. PE A8.2 TaxID=3380349 RepID=UPI003890A420
MRTELFGFKLTATKMHVPELDKGERNPYTSGDEIGNPYFKDKKIEIKEDDVMEVLRLLKQKGYDVSSLE